MGIGSHVLISLSAVLIPHTSDGFDAIVNGLLHPLVLIHLEVMLLAHHNTGEVFRFTIDVMVVLDILEVVLLPGQGMHQFLH